MKALKITATDEISIVDVEQPLYQSLNPVIGGDIEIVRPLGLEKPLVMVVDEEGLIKERELNFIGSVLYRGHEHFSPIVGDVVIMREELGADGYDLASLSEQDIAELIIFCRNILEWRKPEGVV